MKFSQKLVDENQHIFLAVKQLTKPPITCVYRCDALKQLKRSGNIAFSDHKIGFKIFNQMSLDTWL